MGAYISELLGDIRDSGWADVADLAGLIITLIGFGLTLWGLRRARLAVERARESIQKFNVAANFSAAISGMEEIKRLHRQAAWPILPDRYSDLRRILISIKENFNNFSDEEKSVITSSIQQLTNMEAAVESALQNNKPPPQVTRLNRILSDHIGAAQELLERLRNSS